VPPGPIAPGPVMPGQMPPRPEGLHLPPGPGFPGGPPMMPGIIQAMMMNQGPEQAMTVTQMQALEYDRQKMDSTHMEPEVVELAHHFQLTGRHARMLDEQLKKRNNTFEDDIASLYEILRGAKNPADLLMVSIRWMAEGVFNGTRTPNPAVEQVAKKYKLDAPSACKLAEVLESRDDEYGDLKKICSHLERSNRPSSLVMMMLKDLKAGLPVKECTKAPAIGSYLHQKEIARSSQRSRSRGGGRGRRSPSRGRARGGGGGGGRSRSRGRDRDRGRSRSRSRGRGRSRSFSQHRPRSGSRDRR